MFNPLDIIKSITDVVKLFSKETPKKGSAIAKSGSVLTTIGALATGVSLSSFASLYGSSYDIVDIYDKSPALAIVMAIGVVATNVGLGLITAGKAQVKHNPDDDIDLR